MTGASEPRDIRRMTDADLAEYVKRLVERFPQLADEDLAAKEREDGDESIT